MKIEIKEIVPNIYHVEFKNQDDMASAFMRFQEHYENPKFKGKFFSRQTFIRWYKKEKGSFSYYQDWGGFNIPSHIFVPFKDAKFGKMTKNERILLHNFADKLDNKFYVIGTIKGDDSSLKHEIAHGFWYTSDSYRDNMLAEIGKLSYKFVSDVKKWIVGHGCYDESVLDDEVHAYLIGSVNGMWRIRGIEITSETDDIIMRIKTFFEHVLSACQLPTSEIVGL